MIYTRLCIVPQINDYSVFLITLDVCMEVKDYSDFLDFCVEAAFMFDLMAAADWMLSLCAAAQKWRETEVQCVKVEFDKTHTTHMHTCIRYLYLIYLYLIYLSLHINECKRNQTHILLTFPQPTTYNGNKLISPPNIPAIHNHVAGPNSYPANIPATHNI